MLSLTYPRITARRLMLAVPIVSFLLGGVSFWSIIPALEQRNTAKLSREKAQWLELFARSTQEIAQSLSDVNGQPLIIKELSEQNFKEFVPLIDGIKVLTGSCDLFEMARVFEESRQASEQKWDEYEKLSDKGRIEWWHDQARRYQKLSDHISRMKLKYEKAALHPWQPVEPDPPTPD